jgi:DNA polymerase-3 subunit gamma/tau
MAKRKTDSPPAAEPPASKSEYTVVARRYRPQQFAELIGQESVAELLSHAVQGDRVAHAYLFTGARGVGKTSSARILAKALNCVEGPTARPCDRCDICRGIASGDDVDVLEIDAASNRGIDEVREIRQNVQFRPSRARFKVYIIDEVHMLTGPAFNALLKTLEEPPAGVKFILATTEVGKIPITILSRCQRFDFRNIAAPRIAEHLKVIVGQEELEADDAAIDLIARRAGGSMRDAESLLDQLLAFGERLTPELVHRLVGTAPAECVAGIARAIFGNDPASAVKLLHEALHEGAHVGELIDQLVELWRDLMLAASCGNTAPATSGADVQTLGQKASLEAILCGLDILVHAKGRLKFTSLGTVLLEMAVIRLAQLDAWLSVSEAWSRSAARPDASPPPPLTRVAPGPNVEEKKKLLNRLARPA